MDGFVPTSIAIKHLDRPELAGGIGEATYILGTACRRLDWEKLTNYLERIGSSPLIRRLDWLAD